MYEYGSRAAEDFEVRVSPRLRLAGSRVGAGSGRPVIFLHGFGDSRHSWELVRPLLKLREARPLFFPDLRGHGRSSKPSAGYHPDRLAEDVRLLMDALGLAEVDLVGHSLGALTAQRLAAAEPGRVVRLMLLSSAAKVKGNPALLALRQELARHPAITDEFIRDFQTPDRPLPEDFFRRVLEETRLVPDQVWHQTLAALDRVDQRRLLGRVRARVLLLRGDRDPMFSPAEQDDLGRRLGAEIQVSPETGHALHWEAPAFAARFLNEFLNRP